jgi:hypothetical protein
VARRARARAFARCAQQHPNPSTPIPTSLRAPRSGAKQSIFPPQTPAKQPQSPAPPPVPAIIPAKAGTGIHVFPCHTTKSETRPPKPHVIASAAQRPEAIQHQTRRFIPVRSKSKGLGGAQLTPSSSLSSSRPLHPKFKRRAGDARHLTLHKRKTSALRKPG